MHRHAYNDPGHAHFLTFSCYHNHQFLADDHVRHLLAEAINGARQIESFSLWAYVFMPDHVHLQIHPNEDEYSIPAILRRIKEPVTRAVARYWGEAAPNKLDLMKAHQGGRIVHRLWQAGAGYDRNLPHFDAVNKAVEYIEWNPVRRGYVTKPTDWIWSSARAREGMRDVPLGIDSLEVALSSSRVGLM
jgi:putative transposase